jgi:hypothetical protein
VALIVEDGTGLATAESYASVAEADLYHSNLGNTSWSALTTPQKEQYLRQATNFLVQRYRTRWKGWRAYTVQRLDWPRLGVFLDDVAAYPTGGRLSSFAYMVAVNAVPAQVKDATCEAAYIASTGTALTPPTLTQNRLQVKTGPIFVAYDPRSPQTPRFPVIGQILSILLNEVSGAMKVVR